MTRILEIISGIISGRVRQEDCKFKFTLDTLVMGLEKTNFEGSSTVS